MLLESSATVAGLLLLMSACLQTAVVISLIFCSESGQSFQSNNRFSSIYNT